MRRRRRIRVPASSANLGPGFDVLAAALALHIEVEVVETGHFAVVTDLSIARDRRNLVVRGFAQLAPPDDFEFRITSDVPLSGGLGTSAAAYVAGLLAADSIFELDADVLALASSSRGTPTTWPPRCWAASWCARTARRCASTRRRGSRRCSSSRTAPCAPRRRAPRCPPRCRWPTPSSTSPTRRCSCSASRRAASTSSPAGSPTVCTSRAAPRSTRSRWRCWPARRSSARSAPRSPAPARRCWCGASTTPPRPWSSDCGSRRRGGRTCMRVPFEPQGADVRALT